MSRVTRSRPDRWHGALMKKNGTRQLVVSPDTALRLEAAATWLAGYAADAEILVLAPTREAGDDFLRRAALSSGARFGLTRLTPDLLAAILAAPILADAGRTSTGHLSLVAVAARAAHLLTLENELDYFAPVATRPGFPVALSRTLEELRMNQVEADEIRALPRGGADLAVLAERVADELRAARLADRGHLFEAAVAAVEAPRTRHPVGLPLLLLDAPVGSVREKELLAALARRAPAVFATACRGDARTIENIEEALECKGSGDLAGGDESSLGRLKRHLFADSPAASRLDDSVTLRSWPGEARECVEIARRIQAEAASGIRFDRMAVVLRSPGEYRQFLEEAFRRAEIPVYFARGVTRPDPAGRALLALLACAAEGLSARRFAEYLSLAQVPNPDAWIEKDGDWTPPPGELVLPAAEVEEGARTSDEEPLPGDPDTETVIEGSLRAPWRWEQLLVDSAVIGGKDRWQKRLAGLEKELRRKRDEAGDEDETRAALIDRQLHDLGHLRELAFPLIERLAALPSKASWGEWLGHLGDLARQSLRRPEEVIATLSELEPMAPVGPVDLYEVQLVLAPRLRELTIPPPRRRYGRVFIGLPDSVRGMSFDVVLVPGLAEKLFPRKVIEDPILLDEQRQSIASSRLSTQEDRILSERLALRLAVGAASHRVHLSYPRVDVNQARPRVPSFYGLEALRAAEGSLPGFDELGSRAETSDGGRLGWPAPENPADAIDDAEYDLALLAPLVDADPETSAGTAHYLLNANPHLRRALRARARRWLRRWTVADGLVDPDELAREALGKHQLSKRSFSPTALQNYSICPYRFFLQAVHRLQPREDPVAVEDIDPLTRGALFHEVQFNVLTILRQKRSLPVTRETLAAAVDVVDGVLDDVAKRYEDDLAPAIPKVWEDGINSLRADLREWLNRASKADDGWIPHRFELSFGLAGRDRPTEDPASVPDPVPVIADLQLRGSIDLVERREGGILRATDHKTGKVRAQKGFVVGGGRYLQPVLYALACETLLEEPVESGRLYYCTADGGYEERIVELDDRSRGIAQQVIATIGSALAEGFLPAAPEKGACDWCDYRMVCGPVEVFRTSRKPKDRLEPLTIVRELP